MLAAGREELEEILEESDELVLAFAIGEEEREEDGEIAGADDQLTREVFCQLGCGPRVVGEVLEACHTLE